MGALYAPRPPVERPRSGTLDYTDQYDAKMVIWRSSILNQGAEEMRACSDLQRVNEYIKFLDGKPYSPDRPEWRSQYSDNVAMDQRLEDLAALTDIKPTINVSCAVEDYKHQAEIVMNVMKSVWQTQRLQSTKLRDWIDHAEFGTGFLKIVAVEPGQMQFSAKALGNVLPIQMEGNDLQSAVAVVDRSYKSLMYFHEKFHRDKCIGLERYSVNLMDSIQGEKYMRPNNIPEYQWNPLSPAMKRRMHLSRSQQPNQGYPGSIVRDGVRCRV